MRLPAFLEQREWRASCRNCSFDDRSPSAFKEGVRHSRDTGHQVGIAVLMAGEVVGGELG